MHVNIKLKNKNKSPSQSITVTTFYRIYRIYRIYGKDQGIYGGEAAAGAGCQAKANGAAELPLWVIHENLL